MSTDVKSTWKSSKQKKATYDWAVRVFGRNDVSWQFRGTDWCAGVSSHVDGHIVKLRDGATRDDLLNVWRACGGKDVSDDVLNAASLEFENEK